MQCALARIPAGVCLLRGVSRQPKAHAGPYPRDAQHHLFLCGDEREAHEYAKLPPHLVYRYLPRRDVMLLDLRVLAEEPGRLPPHKRQLADRLAEWLQSTAESLDRERCRASTSGSQSTSPAARATSTGSAKEAGARAGADVAVGAGAGGAKPASRDEDADALAPRDEDADALAPRVRAYLRALRFPAVESPHTRDDAAVFAVLANAPMQRSHAQEALASRSTRAFVGSGGITEGSVAKRAAARCRESGGSSQPAGSKGCNPGAAAGGEKSSDGALFIESPLDDIAARVPQDDLRSSGDSSGGAGEAGSTSRQPRGAGIDGGAGLAQPASGPSGRATEAATAAEEHLVAWDGIVRRSRSEYLGRVVTEVLLPAAAFRVSQPKQEAAERVIRAQAQAQARQDREHKQGEEDAERAATAGGKLDTRPVRGAGGEQATVAAKSPPQQPGEAWSFPLTPTSSPQSRPKDSSAGGSGTSDSESERSSFRAHVLRTDPALSLVEIAKVPPERGTADHLEREHVPLHHDAHHADDSATEGVK